MTRSIRLAIVGLVALAACAPPLTGTFSGTKVNPWFPLVPGTTWVYQGVDEGRFVTDVVHVTDQTRAITDNGVTVQATVVTDDVYRVCSGTQPSPCYFHAEQTQDFYATADDGTVWYVGEETAELNQAGQVTSTAGSWQAGVGGAHGGVFMSADPQVGQAFQQESAPDAKDFFQIDAIIFDTMGVHEWSPLEPGVIEHKQYERGVGLTMDGGLALVR